MFQKVECYHTDNLIDRTSLSVNNLVIFKGIRIFTFLLARRGPFSVSKGPFPLRNNVLSHYPRTFCPRHKSSFFSVTVRTKYALTILNSQAFKGHFGQGWSQSCSPVTLFSIIFDSNHAIFYLVRKYNSLVSMFNNNLDTGII